MRSTTILAVSLAVLATPASGPAASPVFGTTLGWSASNWFREDPADSLYRTARTALSGSNYGEAARLFRQLRERYPDSRYTADAFYWEAFARYRQGSADDLREARRLLAAQRDRYPKAATRGDASTLLTRVEGQLARMGDADAAARVSVAAESAAPARPQGAQCDEDEDDTRIAALNALLQMDADRAVPILKRVLARRDRCSEVLRRKAIFLVSQKRSPETESILLSAARQDPDNEVREQAVFWLSQVGTDQAVTALDSILRNSSDVELRKKAVFALAQTHQARASQALRDLAEQAAAPEELREQAIFWLGQSHDTGTGAWLRGLFGRLQDRDLKEKILFSVSQHRNGANQKWLLDVAADGRQDTDLRKSALFWAGQTGVPLADLTALYDRLSDRELREQMIFVYSQRRDSAAVDKLIQIAKSDPDKELRKRAIFWLSQSKDPRAADVLLQLIDQP